MIKDIYLGFAAIFSIIFGTVTSTIQRERYNHFEQAFSELGEFNTSYYLFFNIFVFIIPGVLIFYSIKNLSQIIAISDKDSQNLKIASLGWVITGLFPLSYSIKWLYWFHIGGAVVAFIFGPLGIIILSTKLSEINGWWFFSLFSTMIAFFIWSSILLFDFYLHEAITQLLAILMFFLWYFLFIVKLKIFLTDKIVIDNFELKQSINN